MASKRKFPDYACTDDRVQAWRAAQELIGYAPTLCNPTRNFEGFIFPDASDAYWDSLLVQIPRSEYFSVPIEDLTDFPLAF